MKWLYSLILILLFASCDQGIESSLNPISSPEREINTPLGVYGVMVQVQPKQSVTQLNIAYNINGGQNNVIPMTHQGDGIYRGELPGQPFGNTLIYFVYGETDSGDTLRYPLGEKTALPITFIRSTDFVCAYNSDCYGGEGCIRGTCRIPPEICSLDIDCPFDQNCNLLGDQKCHEVTESCSSNNDCNSGFYCHNSGCLPLGDQCDDDRDCRVGQECSDRGYCQIGTACSSSADCGINGYCHPDIARCILTPECSNHDDCTDPLICNTIIGRCVSRTCQTHFDCDAGQRCDLATGICLEDDNIECYQDDDCSKEKPYCDLTNLTCQECVMPYHCQQGEVCFENICYED